VRRATAPVATRPARHSVINLVIRQKRQCMKAKWQSAWCMIKRASSSKKNNSSLQRAHTFMHIYRDSVRKWPNGTLWLLLGTCICIQMTGSCRNKVAAALYDRFFSQCSLSRGRERAIAARPLSKCQFYSIYLRLIMYSRAHMCHFDKWIWKCAGCGRDRKRLVCAVRQVVRFVIPPRSRSAENYYSDDHGNIYFHFYCSMNTNINGVDFLVYWTNWCLHIGQSALCKKI
jgi:hypothetical protein